MKRAPMGLTTAAHAWRPSRRRLGQPASLITAISAILSATPAIAQQNAGANALQEVVVTAQKRAENLQDVPVAIVALGTQKLDELHIYSLDDYVKYLPSVSYVRSQGQGGNGQPGTTHVYMRGVVSGGDGNHSGSQPSVGTYLDEQPITTIDGTLDIHVYDIQRIEVLAGPQGTLYGASSESGTIRVISNKPDPTTFAAGYDVGVNTVAHGGIGYSAEGFVNLPLSPTVAVRLVGWNEHDAGYISNVAGTSAQGSGIVNGVRTFPTWAGYGGGAIGAGSITNAAYVKKNYNTVDTSGGRALLKLILNDNWTITPGFMGQTSKADGFFGYDPAVGDLKVTHFGPESSNDSFTQSSLTVDGKISNFDVTYAGAYMKRDRHTIADYSDYSFFYDKLYGSGAYWTDSAGHPIDPVEQVLGTDHFTKWSHELRVSTPKDYPVRGTFGVFAQRQVHEIQQDYTMPGYLGDPLSATNPDPLNPSYWVPGWPNTIWLTKEERVDRDSAAFGQVTWDIDPHWSVTGGLRFYKTDNSLQGYYGYAATFAGLGQALCGPNSPPFKNAPCTNLDRSVKESGSIPRFTLDYKIDKDKMLYVTYSKGFRPGGVNRAKDPNTGNFVPPYLADYLTNYEAGWKTQWLGHRVRWNSAFFIEDWKNFQFAFLVPPSLTAIANGGQARIKGFETELEWAVSGGLTLSGSLTLLDPKLVADYCGAFNDSGQAVSANPCPVNAKHPTPYAPLAPAGTTLPVTPKLKANVVARYSFQLSDWDANVQGTVVYQGESSPQLKLADVAALGMNASYTLVDLSAGIERNGMSVGLIISNLFDERAELTRFAQCAPTVCGQTYIIPAQPRTIGVKFGQKF